MTVDDGCNQFKNTGPITEKGHLCAPITIWHISVICKTLMNGHMTVHYGRNQFLTQAVVHILYYSQMTVSSTGKLL